MQGLYYVGLDVHKKTVSACVKHPDGRIVQELTLPATREALTRWAGGLGRPWIGAMEATLFTGWIYDTLLPYARELKVGHPAMMQAIAASKKKNDELDARKIADLVRCDLLPECYMAPQEIRGLRRELRHRHFLTRTATRLKNKAAGLLMECGVEYSKKKLHGRKYFASLLNRLSDTHESLSEMLRFDHGAAELLERTQKRMLGKLEKDPLLRERVERLTSIPGVGPVTALTWALETGDPHRFGSIGHAVSYCGLCSAHRESAGKTARGPISKQRNKHLQWVLIEAAKAAPRWNPGLRALHQREAERSNKNQATLTVARKLVAYLLAVDKSGQPFVERTAPAGQASPPPKPASRRRARPLAKPAAEPGSRASVGDERTSRRSASRPAPPASNIVASAADPRALTGSRRTRKASG